MPQGSKRAAPQGKAAFGDRLVAEVEKASLVGRVFSSVASRYDLMNDLMSLGVHRLWKAAFMDWLGPRPSMRLLDVGGGTGDIAFRFLERGGTEVLVCDANSDMLERGRARAIDRGYLEGITWIGGDAEALPIADGTMDAYATAFCIRNVTRIPQALAEAKRPDARLVVTGCMAERYGSELAAALPEVDAVIGFAGESSLAEVVLRGRKPTGVRDLADLARPAPAAP